MMDTGNCYQEKELGGKTVLPTEKKQSRFFFSYNYLDPTWSVFAYCCQVLYF